jgi:hypothetical protein
MWAPHGPCIIMPKELWEVINCDLELDFESGGSR